MGKNSPKLFVNLHTVGGKELISITVNGKERVDVSPELAEMFARSILRTVKLAKRKSV